MNKAEVKLLLADVAAIDNRRVSEETVTAWYGCTRAFVVACRATRTGHGTSGRED
jgi:hypothetical protein